MVMTLERADAGSIKKRDSPSPAGRSGFDLVGEARDHGGVSVIAETPIT